MNLHQCIFTNSSCYKKATKITPKGIMVHSTGANNPNLRRYVGPDDGLLGKNSYNNHWNRSGMSKCVHAFIGLLGDGKTVATYQTLPFNINGWHAGGAANNTHIGFEICEDNRKNAEYLSKVYQEAVEFCAYLCKMYNFDPLGDGVIIGHYEGKERGIASNHGDPRSWFKLHGRTMEQFRGDVAALMDKPIKEPTEEPKAEPEAPKQPTEETKEEPAKKLYRVRKTWEDKASQTGAYHVLANAIKGCKPGCRVFDENGKAVYSNTLELGDMVKMQKGAPVYGKSYTFSSWVYNRELFVRSIDGDKVTISTHASGAITGRVDIKYLTKIA